MGEYEPEMLKILRQCCGEPVTLSAEERQIIEHARRVTAGGNRAISVIVNGVPTLIGSQK